MSKELSFPEVVNKLVLLNPEANIMFSSKSEDMIWSEVPADELVLPPYVGAVEKMPVLNFPNGQVQVKNFGE